MDTPTIMDQRKPLVITLDAGALPALGLAQAPEPGAAFTLTGAARAHDAYPGDGQGPAQVSFELTPERLEPRTAQAAPAPQAPAQAAPGAAAPAPGGADDAQKRREAFFRSLFQGDD